MSMMSRVAGDWYLYLFEQLLRGFKVAGELFKRMERLSGPKMAVAAYFSPQPWAAQMSSWDKVIAAGESVRLVVADQNYTETTVTMQQKQDVRTKFDLCRNAGQMVFGYVYGAGGQIPVGPPGVLYDDPANPVTKKPCVGDQIDAWHMDYGNNIDGIYVDVGPVECTHTHPDIPSNYRDYVNYIRQFSSYNYRVFLLTPQYPDSSIAEPNFTPWLQKLNADYLGLWEQGTWEYENQYWALDYCDSKQPGIGVPAWWDPGLPWRRTKRVHTINDCADEATMRKMADLAKKRGAWTVCITQRVNDKYDQLPPYWDAMTEVFAPLTRLYVRKS